MPAYSFKRRFVVPVARGLGVSYPIDFIETMEDRPKRQTIRAVGRRRHARPGEIVQCYYAMRTKQCFKIGDGRCIENIPVRITVPKYGAVPLNIQIGEDASFYVTNDFANSDGFASESDMHAFWRKEHGPGDFFGVLIKWEPLT